MANVDKNTVEPVVLPSAQRLKKRSSKTDKTDKTGDQYSETLYNGREVTWKLVVVPADQVNGVEVWKENERSQALLNAHSLSDITATLGKHGNDVPGKGRYKLTGGGIIQVADGSRRRKSCELQKAPYKILVADLTDDEMTYFSEIGNRYDPPSAWEKGERYLKLEKQAGSLRKVEQHLKDLGENVSRRTIKRCQITNSLPISFMKKLSHPGALSPEAGEKLAKLWQKTEATMADLKGFKADKESDDSVDVQFLSWVKTTLEAKIEKPEADKAEEMEMAYSAAKIRKNKLTVTTDKLTEKQLEWLKPKLEQLFEDLHKHTEKQK